jgi:hypothetical protein
MNQTASEPPPLISMDSLIMSPLVGHCDLNYCESSTDVYVEPHDTFSNFQSSAESAEHVFQRKSNAKDTVSSQHDGADFLLKMTAASSQDWRPPDLQRARSSALYPSTGNLICPLTMAQTSSSRSSSALIHRTTLYFMSEFRRLEAQTTRSIHLENARSLITSENTVRSTSNYRPFAPLIRSQKVRTLGNPITESYFLAEFERLELI